MRCHFSNFLKVDSKLDWRLNGSKILKEGSEERLSEKLYYRDS